MWRYFWSAVNRQDNLSVKKFTKDKFNNKRNNFDDDFWFNPLLQNNVHNVKDIEFIFHHLMSQFVKLKDSVLYVHMDWSFRNNEYGIIYKMYIHPKTVEQIKFIIE